MIVKKGEVKTFSLLIACNGSIVPAIFRKVILSVVLAVLATALRLGLFGDGASNATEMSFAPFTALGVAISLFLGFHNNASYSRWWEARTYWGTLIIYMRNLSRFLMCYCEGPDIEDLDEYLCAAYTEEGEASNMTDNSVSPDKLKNFQQETQDWRVHLILLSVAHTHALRAQLRPYSKSDGENQAIQDRDRFLSPSEVETISHSKNPANAILIIMGKILGEAYKISENNLDSYTRVEISRHIDNLCEIQTACERIKNTSLPIAYSLLVARTSFLYVFFVPFAMASTMRWWTPIFTGIVAYTFFGLDKLSRQIKEPFNDKPMCLALSAMSRVNEIDALEIIKCKHIPPYLLPHKDILM